MSDMRCEWDKSSFSATAIYTGENRMIRVRGSGTCPQGGYVVALEGANPGINPKRSRLALQLVETPPEAGTDVITPVTVDELFEVSQQINEVTIRPLRLALQVKEPG